VTSKCLFAENLFAGHLLPSLFALPAKRDLDVTPMLSYTHTRSFCLSHTHTHAHTHTRTQASTRANAHTYIDTYACPHTFSHTRTPHAHAHTHSLAIAPHLQKGKQHTMKLGTRPSSPLPRRRKKHIAVSKHRNCLGRRGGNWAHSRRGERQRKRERK